MKYTDLKTGNRIEMEILVNKHTMSEKLSWEKGTIYEDDQEPFFKKRVRLDNGMNEPIMEHRMYLIRQC